MDGENLTIRGAAVAESQRLKLIEGFNYSRDKFLWIPHVRAEQLNYSSTQPLDFKAVRAHYYTSVCGDEPAILDVRASLWSQGFTPVVFKKPKSSRSSKGVDIALTKDLLSHGFLGNYDTAVLITGDADYIPVIEEVKRLGKRVILAFFEDSNLPVELRLAADGFHDLLPAFITGWKSVPSS